MHFGISTHLFRDRPLAREHVALVASHGFEAIELFATRSHFDYHDESVISRLAEWLSETGLALESVHAPIADRVGPGATWYSTALTDAPRRQAAIREAEAALRIAARIPFRTLVVHVGTATAKSGPGDNSRAAALRSAEEICGLADAAGVRVAFEVIPNNLSSPASLVSMLEQDLDAPWAGICLDFGHAHLLGDVPDAIETVAEHLIATHVHDNRGRTDDHLVPFAGSINWDSALVTMQKVGYDGPYMMELGCIGSPEAVLGEARRARERVERTLTHA